MALRESTTLRTALYFLFFLVCSRGYGRMGLAYKGSHVSLFKSAMGAPWHSLNVFHSI